MSLYRQIVYQRRWRYPKILIALMIIELGGTVAALALFGIATPDLFRTKLWQVGYDNKFNSSPAQILYAYANHVKIPTIPFVWSQTLDSFNVAISVLSMFILLCKCVMFAMHVWYPFLGTIVNLCITILWIVSVYGQAGPDHSDPLYPSSSAWYIRKSCIYAQPSGNEHYCEMAKGTFATTVVMMVVFLLNFLLGVYSLYPTAAERAQDKLELDDMQGEGDSPAASERGGEREWEMKNIETGAAVGNKQPFTPRTLAFNTLDRKLPLRKEEAPKVPRFA